MFFQFCRDPRTMPYIPNKVLRVLWHDKKDIWSKHRFEKAVCVTAIPFWHQVKLGVKNVGTFLRLDIRFEN